mmetsp:Transcript_34308/g.41048  ORF Transcript_34308/g.41048 Transcript_34308/m.41048 type:complete len:113 (+) Transcript_34308:198-536(+)|eukprot:CAMPEP_0198249524 /NCGR_PEP_ID=MMETSP1447-20131203/1032_1 /TAXON_ID=420782 /ORGANISM="Chaetoceros dichaeta, Strain CCMP1751" /LENGTH=112 /DNA_ID=CAMNT_0043934183 /DNA_START=210 /DNA_END=548 /DNA_ORIENTATION=-
MAPKSQPRPSSGGLKGFFRKAGKSFYTGGLFATDQSVWMAEKLCKIGFIIATTSIVALMPLIFEIAREGQMVESEKIQVRELRNDGYSDRQLQEMGFCEPAVLRAPSVALKK